MAGGSVAERLERVRATIQEAAERANRPAGSVRLIAVSKTMPATVIRQAIEAGVTDLAENRVQEAQEKIPGLRDQPARWHLIGHLQSNKAGKALELFTMIQSVDSLSLATLLSRRAERRHAPIEALFEVNVAGEATKSGFTPEELLVAAPALAILPGIVSRGLMTVAPAVADPEGIRPVFRRMRQLRDQLTDVFGPAFTELSMGMSHDYAVAIGEGATMVRIGTAIFGERDRPG